MADRDVRDALGLVDRPIQPSEGFTDGLFERLVEEAGRRPVTPLRRRPSPQTRRILTIAASLVPALAVLALTLGPLRNLIGNDRTAGDLDETTPFRAVIVGHIENLCELPTSRVCFWDETSGEYRLELMYRAPDSWRIEAIGGSSLGHPLTNSNVTAPGDFLIRDGERTYEYSSEDGVYIERRAAPGFSPLNLLGSGDERSGWQEACANATSFPDEELLGRPVHHLRCSTSGSFGDSVELWVDAGTGLILKIVSHIPESGPEPPTELPGPFDKFQPGEVMEIVRLEYAPSFAEGTFTFTPPPGSTSYLESLPPPTSLSLGEAVPLQVTDALDLSPHLGRSTAIYAWASWCPPCIGAPLDAFDRASRELSEELDLVSIAYSDGASERTALIEQNGYTMPVVSDRTGAIGKLWGFTGIPTLVLIDAEGNLAGVYAGGLTDAEMTEILSAFADGERLPHARISGLVNEQIP